MLHRRVYEQLHRCSLRCCSSCCCMSVLSTGLLLLCVAPLLPLSLLLRVTSSKIDDVWLRRLLLHAGGGRNTAYVCNRLEECEMCQETSS